MLIALFDLHPDPVLERLSYHGGTDVDNPLLRRLHEVSVIREEVGNVWLVGDEFQDLLDAQGLVLRHVEVLDLIIQQVPLLLV